MRQEVRSVLQTNGVQGNNILHTIPGTDISIKLLKSISNAIDRIEVFKNEQICFHQSEANGDPSQLVLRPTAGTIPNVDSDVQPTDYTKDSDGTSVKRSLVEFFFYG